MNAAENYIKTRLDQRRQDGGYRSLKPENNLVDFCSNDYLGFARSAVLQHMLAEEIENHPHLNGATGSRLISGNTVYTEDLEQEIADLFGAEAGLLFNSGYDANLGLLSSLPQRGDTIITDELIHASLIDGARLSHANRYTFKHNDLASLETKLQNAKGLIYVVTESIFSMDGDSPKLEAMLALTEKYQANLIVDEAHAVGLYKTGIVSNLGLQDRVFARVITFGKGLGCHGAIVLGTNLLRQYLINYARSFIYTTAAPFHQLATAKSAFRLLQTSDLQIDELNKVIELFKKTIATKSGSEYALIDSDSAIQCILLKNNDKAKATAAHLQAKGFDVRAILSPTVAEGSERIRICLHAYNTADEITLLANQINHLLNE
ncbi:8-amino-7-oxononanoate synthase [Mucilaginibacter sp. dw_454]|uniref:aminotransferase class I/II-fold pyridoxal phosphate-dependent enzyme n=1 Tax=Mucilaginibacter sp. dw_454 TaxID=2720079 RepID=UPI001BD26EC3|nr:8-amino-7-oxononanoate synthase [Mucilaginibacter sp. dw_454]